MENINEKELKEKIISQLKHIFDPEIPVNIYDLGLIYDIQLEEKDRKIICNIDMTLTSPGCPVADSLVGEAQNAVNTLNEIDEVFINLVFTPPWDKDKVSDDGKDMMLANGFLL